MEMAYTFSIGISVGFITGLNGKNKQLCNSTNIVEIFLYYILRSYEYNTMYQRIFFPSNV